MSWLSDYLRRRRIDPAHQTRRALARHVAKHGFVIGDYTYGTPHILFRQPGVRLVVGSYSCIGTEVWVYLGGNHRTDWVTTFPFKAAWPEAQSIPGEVAFSRGDVIVGSDVWIGAGATILSGVRIGDGAVVGARAVVSQDVPPYGIVAGNPARLIRTRFSAEVVEALLAIRWWEFPRERLVPLLPLLQSDRVAEFIAACRGA